MHIPPLTIFYALLGGILPALIWLFFWLFEDTKRPEPKSLILRTFTLGMIAVPLVIPFQLAVNTLLPGSTTIAFLLWAIIEEVFKLGAAYWGGLRSKEDDEPLDPLIYMITAALGFAAFENALFIATPLLGGELATGIIIGNFRFMGASLLHTVSSGIIGVAMAFAFYKPKWRVPLILLFFVVAVLFHAAFNIFINSQTDGNTIFAFGAVWAGIALLLLIFERVKQIAR